MYTAEWTKSWRKDAENTKKQLAEDTNKCQYFLLPLTDNLELRYIPYKTGNSLAGELQIQDKVGYGLYANVHIKADTPDEFVTMFINNTIERYGHNYDNGTTV